MRPWVLALALLSLGCAQIREWRGDPSARDSVPEAQRFAKAMQLGLDVTPGATWVTEATNIGFGLRRVRLEHEAGRCTASALVFGDRSIALLSASCSGAGRARFLEEVISSSWKKTANGDYELEHRDENVFRLAEEARGATLGKVAEPIVPDALAPAYRALTSPFSYASVAASCGESDSPSEDFLQVESIVAAGRVDMFRAILRGPSPAGRGFAANALHRMHALSPEDLNTIAALAQEPGELGTCHGCSVMTLSTREFFGGAYRYEPRDR